MEIPIWHKATLTPEEAAAYGDIDVKIIRIFGQLAKLGRSDFPSFYCGSHLRINRALFDEWLAELARGHHSLELANVRKTLAGASAPVKVGRPRKDRAGLQAL